MILANKRSIALFALGCTMFTCSVVTVTMLVLYPPEEWLWELSLSNTLTMMLTYPICTLVGHQMYRNQLLTAELQHMLEFDRLTGAASRDHFFAVLGDVADVSGVTLMIDIDHFKRVNDTYGHFVGDAVIKSTAEVLQGAVRAEDIVCRFGGEEFVLFLPDLKAHEAEAMASRILQAVRTNMVTFGSGLVAVTVSIGAAVKRPTEALEISLQRADDCLYRAKRSGRDRAEFYWSPPEGENPARADPGHAA